MVVVLPLIRGILAIFWIGRVRGNQIIKIGLCDQVTERQQAGLGLGPRLGLWMLNEHAGDNIRINYLPFR